jgi:hypothetical protein
LSTLFHQLPCVPGGFGVSLGQERLVRGMVDALPSLEGICRCGFLNLCIIMEEALGHRVSGGGFGQQYPVRGIVEARYSDSGRVR